MSQKGTMNRAFRFIFLILGAVLLGTERVQAQWTTQTISLRAGWNAVHLQVDPQPGDCTSLFAGTKVESIWSWNRRFSTIQFIQNPGDLIPGQQDWLVWGAGEKYRAVTSLWNLQAEHTYLIKVTDNAAPFSISIKGKPMVRAMQWVPDSFNLVGLHVDPLHPPTFKDFFAPSAAHAGQPMYRLDASGVWNQVNVASDKPRPGEAYWVRCSGVSTYSGPVTINVEQGRSIDYGNTLQEQTVTIRNSSTQDRVISVQQMPSAQPPTGTTPELAGNVPLSSFVMDYPTTVGFQPLNQPLTKTVPAGSTWSLRLAVRRQDLPTPQSPSANSQYQSLLQISDGAGVLHVAPVTASGGSPLLLNGAHTGLWVGTATINKVSQGGDATNCPTCPIPTNTASPFQFRILVHEATNGQASLLQKAFVTFKGGGGTNQYSGNAGSYVLIAGDPTLKSNLYDVIVRRFSAPAFGFSNTIAFAPTNAPFGSAGTVLTAPVILGYDDPTNPFKHLYHPDHDNKDDAYNPLQVTTNAGWPANQTVAGPRTSESYTVTRYLTLQFTATDPENLTLPGWGDTILGGNYSETITGLHKNPLYISGTFRLHLAVNAGTLN